MKKLTYTLLIFFITVNSIVAQHHGKREKLKAYKTAYLTEQLDLSSKEAEKFWPIYNTYEKKYFQLKVNKMTEMKNVVKEQGGFESLTENEANQLLLKLTTNEQAIIDAKKDLYSDLKKILPAKKILMLNKAEHDFNRKLLSDYRNKKHRSKNK